MYTNLVFSGQFYKWKKEKNKERKQTRKENIWQKWLTAAKIIWLFVYTRMFNNSSRMRGAVTTKKRMRLCHFAKQMFIFGKSKVWGLGFCFAQKRIPCLYSITQECKSLQEPSYNISSECQHLDFTSLVWSGILKIFWSKMMSHYKLGALCHHNQKRNLVRYN